ncbi:MAG TPA: hypothetical protein VD997_10915 [Phycisphaerales bacterium]|nr:hypothetical protein [Phycisphaerales bacterium]
MRMFARLFVLVLVAGILVPTFMLWDATGRKGFTALPNPNFEQMQKSDGSLSGLFGEEAAPAQAPIDNSFRFGLLPAGVGPEAMSVAMVGGPAILLGLMAFCRGKKVCPKKG